jgi:cellulose biosynthesis protein BcsQ
VFNLAWMLAEKGHKVLMVDSDPQPGYTAEWGFDGAS